VCLVQDDKPEQIVNKAEETSAVVIDESGQKESGPELSRESTDADVGDGEDEDESPDCILEDVLLIDSDDGIDEDTNDPSNEAGNGIAKPSGINVSFIM